MYEEYLYTKEEHSITDNFGEDNRRVFADFDINDISSGQEPSLYPNPLEIAESEEQQTDKPTTLDSNHLKNEEQLIGAYNSRLDLSQYCVSVAETDSSIEARRFGDPNNKVTFKKNRRQGDYWVVNLESGCYLVPKYDIKLKKPNIRALQSLFACNEIESIDDLLLIKPCKVTKKEENWELEEIGTLKFISAYELLQSYNNDPKLLYQKGVKVSISDRSLENYRMGSNQATILNKDRRGDYFIFNHNGIEYLFPKPDIKTHKYMYEQLEILFVCKNYNPTINASFELIKPTKLQALSQGKEWKLKEKGEIRFI